MLIALLAGAGLVGAWASGLWSGARDPSPARPEAAQGSASLPERASTVDEASRADVPAWAKVSAGQVAAGNEHRLPVAVENSFGMRFVLIPPGEYTMGSPTTEEGRAAGEAEHEVELTRPFYVSIHEVTNGQYRRFKAKHDSGSHMGESLNGDLQPVVEVTHDDATEFAAWLSRQDRGRPYRLLTESEWEYACRAGSRTAFWFGATITPQQANYDGRITYGSTPEGLNRAKSTTVGTFAPNGWGLYDMHGNVWEWCSDRYGEYPKVRVRDPQGPSSGTRRVLRGGCWFEGPDILRSAARDGATPVFRDSGDGFRLAFFPPPT